MPSTKVIIAFVSAAVVVAAAAFLVGPKPDTGPSEPSAEIVAASGATTVAVVDPVHERPFEVSTWSPAESNGTLVVISHGFSGHPTSYDDLARSLADAGYTVAAPTHPDVAGLTSNDPRLDPFVLRPHHLSLTIDHMVGGTDFDRVVVVGHSLGGYSALRVAGVAPSGATVDAHCTAHAEDDVLCSHAARSRIEQLTSDPVDQSDARIDAVVLMAPGYGPLFSSQDLAELGAKALVIAASSDDELPGGQVDALLAAMPPATESLTVNGGHYVFLRTCTDGERAALPELCIDDPTVDRADVNAEVVTTIEAFLSELS